MHQVRFFEFFWHLPVRAKLSFVMPYLGWLILLITGFAGLFQPEISLGARLGSGLSMLAASFTFAHHMIILFTKDIRQYKDMLIGWVVASLVFLVIAHALI
jgi:hypothetical protein